MSLRPKLHKNGTELTPCKICNAPRFFKTYLSKTIGGRKGYKIHLIWCDTCIDLYKENQEKPITSQPKFIPKEWITKALEA